MPLLEKPRRARRTVEGGCPHANLARFLWHYFQLQLVSPAQYGQRRTDAYAHLGEHAIQIVDAGYGMPLQRNDDVSFAQACALRGAIFFDPNHHRAHFLRQVVEADHAPVHGHRLRRDADVAAANAAIAQQAAGYELRRVDADGKTNALRGQNGRRVHAYHAAGGINQRAARVARVQRSVGLNDVIDQPPGIRTERPTQRTHHARSYSRLESVGRANRNHDLPHAQALGIAERSRSQSGFVHANDRQIAGRIVADDRRRHAASVGQSDYDADGLMHDVAVSEDQSVWSENESRATTAPFARFARPRPARALVHFNIHHRWAHALDRSGHRRGIGVEQGIVHWGALWRDGRSL